MGLLSLCLALSLMMGASAQMYSGEIMYSSDLTEMPDMPYGMSGRPGMSSEYSFHTSEYQFYERSDLYMQEPNSVSISSRLDSMICFIG